MSSSTKIALTGAAGLIGQNLIVRLKARGYSNIVARASTDDELVEILGLRGDLPENCMRDLLRRMTAKILSSLRA